MVFEALQARLGMGGRQRRFIDIESVRDLEDISDPETTEDESDTSLLEWAGQHPGWAILSAVLTVLVVGLVARYTLRFAPALITNPWSYVIGGTLLVGWYIYRRGWRARDKNVTKWDELSLKSNGESTTYKGRYIDLPGRSAAFIPIKGWSGLFSKPRPYANGELAAGMNQSFDPWEMDDDKAAVIRLEPGERGNLIGVTDTEWGGKKIVQETGGLEPDPHGNHTSLKCSLPEFGDKRAEALKEQIEQITSDYYDAVEEVEALQRRNRELKDRMNEPIDDQMNRRIEEHERIAATRGVSRGHSIPNVPPKAREDWRGTGSMDPNEKELQEVKEELTDDEE